MPEETLLQQALAKVKPEYGSRSQEERDEYSVHLPTDEIRRIVAVLHQIHFQIWALTKPEQDAAYDRLHQDQLGLLIELRKLPTLRKVSSP